MSGMTRTEIIGNVGKDAEMRYTKEGVAVTTFTVAVNLKRGNSKRTQWYKVTAWRKLGEVCANYVKKGMQIYVSGTIDASHWTTQSGETRVSLDLTADDVLFLGGGSGQSQQDNAPREEYENIPF